MGYKGRLTGHGFRGLASTCLYEQQSNGDHIETQLAHLERSTVSGAYNYAEYVEPRKKMKQDWRIISANYWPYGEVCGGIMLQRNRRLVINNNLKVPEFPQRAP